MKTKLLNPTELKQFRLQQEKQKKLFAAKLKEEEERKEKENKKLISPKELLDHIDIEVESVVETEEIEVQPKTPIEILTERIDTLSILLNEIQNNTTYEEQIAKLEVLVATKIGIDEFSSNEFNLNQINEKIVNLKNSIPVIPEVKTYDQEITELRSKIEQIKIPEIPDSKIYDEEIESLTERVDQLQISGSEIFTQHGENIKEIKKVLLSLVDDFDKLKIPTPFDSSILEDNIQDVKTTLQTDIIQLKKQISEFPEIKTYDKEFEKIETMVEGIRNSIPEIPEIKSYEEEFEEIQKQIKSVEKSIPKLPEVRYYEKEIQELKENIKQIENSIPTIPEIPDIPEIKYYDEDIQKLNERIEEVKKSVGIFKNSLNKVSTNVKNIDLPEYVDWTHEIEYLYNQIEKLKEKPVNLKETEETTNNLLPSKDVTKKDDALAPLDQKFVTFEDLSSHYRTFIMRVQQQLSTLGGGGEVNLRFLDDIDRTSIQDGRVLSYNATTKKFVFISPGAAASLWDETLDGNVYRESNVGINTDDPQVALDVYGDVNVTGVITAFSFSGTATEAIKITEVDKTLNYISGTLSTITTLYGTKTLYYDQVGILTSIAGTGIYESKEFTYDNEGNLIFVNVL